MAQNQQLGLFGQYLTVNSSSNLVSINTASVNAVSYTIGTALTANATLVNAAAINITGQTNTATLYVTTSANVGTAVLANASGVYTTGTVNAASYTVGTTFTANSTLVNAAAINVVNQTNTATLYVTTSANVGTYFTVNSSAAVKAVNASFTGANLYVTGTNTYITANTLLGGLLTTISNTVTFGTAAYFVSNGNFGIGTSSPGYKLDVTGDIRASANIYGTLATTSQPNITANNSSYLGGTAAASYQLNSTLAANVATLTSNNATNAFGKTEGNLNVNNATTALTANNSTNLGGVAASGYQTTAGLSANVATLTSNNTTYLNGQLASYYGVASSGTYYYPVINTPIFAPDNLDPSGKNIGTLYGGGSSVSGRTIMGWNRSAGGGEFNIIINRDGGGVGGLNVRDWSNTASGNNTSDSSIFYVTGDGTGWVKNTFTVGTNTLTIGTAAYYVANGNLGLGTASPAATLDVVGTVNTSKANTLNQTLTDGATISWDTSLGQVSTVTLAGNRTMAAPTNLKVQTYILHVLQDATGSRTLTWNSVFKWPAGVAPTLTTTANARDIFSFVSDGTNLYGSFLPNVK